MASTKVPKHLQNPPPGKNLYEIDVDGESRLRLATPAKAKALKEAGAKITKKAGDAK